MAKNYKANRYKEIAMRFQSIGMREFNEGDVVRTVAISDEEAIIMNEHEASKDPLRGGPQFQYILEGEKTPAKKNIK